MKIVVIGDVHGCLDELRNLLDCVGTYDRLVFLGDLLDRGPNPIGVLRFVRGLRAECVLGNHEEKHLRFATNAAREAAGGEKNAMRPFTGERAEQHAALTPDDLAWIAALPAYIEIGDRWLAVHAGFLPDAPIQVQDPKKVCRVRWVNTSTRKMISTSPGDPEPPPGGIYWTNFWSGPRDVLYGHNVHSLEKPFVTQTSAALCYGIDTGCCFGGRLTAAVLADEDLVDFISVPALRKYAELIGAGVE